MHFEVTNRKRTKDTTREKPGRLILLPRMSAPPIQMFIKQSQSLYVLWLLLPPTITHRNMPRCAASMTDATSWWFARGQRALAPSGRTPYRRNAWWSKRPVVPWWRRSQRGAAAWRSSDPRHEPTRGCSQSEAHWRFSPASRSRPKRWPVWLQTIKINLDQIRDSKRPCVATSFVLILKAN